MPYIICENLPGCLPEGDPTAVEDLFDAREQAAHLVEQIVGGDPDWESVYTDAQNCSELGDVFGPLPNGYVVEVKRVGWQEMTRLAGVLYAAHPDRQEEPSAHVKADILDAYNS